MRIKVELKELMIVSLEQNANGWIHTSLNTPWRKTGEETRIVKPRFIKKQFWMLKNGKESNDLKKWCFPFHSVS